MRDTGDIVWAPRGHPTPLIEVSQLRCSLHIWGVVWDTGRIFQLYDGHLTAAMYVDLLEQYILPEKENLGHRVFLLDRHPAHTAKCTTKWLANHQLDCKVLPTHSPQFNAIEHCWAWIKHRVRELRPDSPAMMQAHLESAFDALPQDVIQANLRNVQHNLRAYCEVYREH
jgi:transposase